MSRAHGDLHTMIQRPRRCRYSRNYLGTSSNPTIDRYELKRIQYTDASEQTRPFYHDSVSNSGHVCMMSVVRLSSWNTRCPLSSSDGFVIVYGNLEFLFSPGCAFRNWFYKVIGGYLIEDRLSKCVPRNRLNKQLWQSVCKEGVLVYTGNVFAAFN